LIKFIVIAAIVVVGVVLILRKFGGARVAPEPKRLNPPTITTDSSAVTVEVDGEEIQIDPAVMAEIRTLLAKNQKIEAIKVLREATGLGLAEAKTLVESLAELKN
jgi:antitoxin component of MazEF toxin-antitoxin module